MQVRPAGRLYALFVDRPILTLMATIALLLVGVIALLKVPLAFMPSGFVSHTIRVWIPVSRPMPPREVEETIAKVEDEPPRGPLEQFALKVYKLMLIMSGTAVPKAVVVDPKQQAYVIQRDTRIGSKGGIVESITQYMVVVKEPNEEEAIKITIKPPYLDLATRPDFEDEEAPAEEDFAIPPVRPVNDAP